MPPCSNREPGGLPGATRCMDRYPTRPVMPDPALTAECAWCFDPSQETVTALVRGKELELDLCLRHLDELLAGSRPTTT
jgi:hypothetical protein